MVQTLEAQGPSSSNTMVNLVYVQVGENTNLELIYVDIEKFTTGN
jgi:hypothetical protein